MLIEKCFSLKKLENISIDIFLNDVKEVFDLLLGVNIDLSKDVVVYYDVKNFHHQYKIFKRMILNAN